MWDFASCNEAEQCQEHITFHPYPNLYWALHQDQMSYYLLVFVRSFHSAIVFFSISPHSEYPRIAIQMGLPTNASKVIFQSQYKCDSVILEVNNLTIDYWKWTQLYFQFFDKEIHVLKDSEGSRKGILKVKHELINMLRWFSIGSDHSITHWSLYCLPEDLPPAYPPDCGMTPNDIYYKGTQWVSESGKND